MRLVWKHELCQHVFVSGYGDWILVFHDRAAINIEGGYQDILYMVLAGTSRILRAQFPGILSIGI